MSTNHDDGGDERWALVVYDTVRIMVCLFCVLSCNQATIFPRVFFFLTQNLLRRLLEKDPEHRIDLAAAINHPWVTVEGSVRSDGLDISEDPGGDDAGVQVCALLVRLVVLFPFSMSFSLPSFRF